MPRPIYSGYATARSILRLCYCPVRAGAPPAMSWRTRVPVTRSEATVGAMDGSRSDDSEFEEERAGGGPDPSRRRAGAGGPWADPGRRRLSGVLAEHSLIGWRRRHSACKHMHTGRYDHSEVVLTLS